MKEISLERFNAARRSWVEAGKFRFQIQRPTLVDVIKESQSGASLSIEFAARFVVGWQNVDESDLIPGGDPEPAAFAPALFAAWVAERPDLWKAISEGIQAAWKQHEEQTEARGNA